MNFFINTDEIRRISDNSKKFYVDQESTLLEDIKEAFDVLSLNYNTGNNSKMVDTFNELSKESSVIYNNNLNDISILEIVAAQADKVQKETINKFENV